MDENIKKTIKESYNKNSKHRDKTEIELWKINELKKVLSIIDDKHNCSILDMGSGNGLYGKYFENNGLDVTCIDLSTNMINLCKQKGLKALEMDFYDLKFKDEEFNVVWSLNTLLHVPKSSIKSVLKGIDRVLKKQGCFYMGLYGGETFEGIYEDDFYKPQRFFTFYEDEEIILIVKEFFDVISFESIKVENRRMRFQSILMKKKD